MRITNQFINDNKGQGLVEYGLILALVSVVAVSSLGGVGDKVTSTLSIVGNVGEEIDEDINNKIEQGYIPVATADELNSIRENNNQTFGAGTNWEKAYDSGLGKDYIQVADIDLGHISNWEPIGNMTTPYTGTFDGGGFSISNVTIDRPSVNYVGLFGNVNNATLKNIRAESVDVTGSHGAGGLVGSLDIDNQVINCYSSGEVSGVRLVGGLAGRQRLSEIVNSSSSAKALGLDKGQMGHTGGLVGHNRESIIRGSYSTGAVVGMDHVGGLVGSSWTDLTRPSLIINSYSTSSVIGGGVTGGLVGSNQGTIINSSWAKDINGNIPGIGLSLDDDVGDGVFGKSKSEIEEIINRLNK